MTHVPQSLQLAQASWRQSLRASMHSGCAQGCSNCRDVPTLAGTRWENFVNWSSWVPWKGLSGASRRGCCPLAAAEELGELLRTGTSCHCPTAPLGDPLLLLAAMLASPAAGASACRAMDAGQRSDLGWCGAEECGEREDL